MSRRPITLRQATVLIGAKLRLDVPYEKVRRAIHEVARQGRIAERPAVGMMLLPDELDRVAGEVWRARAGWSERRNVKGDVEAWVTMPGQDEPLLLLVPYARTWVQAEKREHSAIADSIECHEWPTGRVSGVLVRVGDKDGVPAYEWRDSL